MENSTYALLVGIDNYCKISGLNGCVNDITKVEQYLQMTSNSCSIIKLIDTEATKDVLIRAFKRIEDQITATDNMLFYFAGHGTREVADPAWKETSGLLQCIVCYDRDIQPASYLLADKELRYLIYKLSKISKHIVTIFDCCHSGNNTRNGAFLQSNYTSDKVLERHASGVFPGRHWDNFIFNTIISQNDINNDIDTFLPLGSHVQISACESDEGAVEINGEGVFTKALINILKNVGNNISYFSLRSRIRQYLRFIYQQQPRIFATGATELERQQLLFSTFLNNDVNVKHGFCSEAVLNKKNGWLINLGVIHGVTSASKVFLKDSVFPFRVYPATIKELFIDHAILKLEDDSLTSFEHTSYKAWIDGLQMNEMTIHIINYDGDSKPLKFIADELIKSSAGHFILTDDETSANYTLHVRSGQVYITHPCDSLRPLIQPIRLKKNILSDADISEEINLNKVSEILRHISKWHFIRNLRNTKTLQPKADLIKVTIIQQQQSGSEVDIPIKNESATVKLDNSDSTYKSSLRISFTNQSAEKLFIAVADLSFQFQSTVNTLERTVELLDSGESVSLVSRSSKQTDRNFINITLPRWWKSTTGKVIPRHLK